MPRRDETHKLHQRDRILDAAERCFVRHGFHGASMQTICAEAGVSAGALYLYFPAKVALIAGIVERDRRQIARDFAAVSGAPDLLAAFGALGRQYLKERPIEKCQLFLEITSEATRSPAIAGLCREVDEEVRAQMTRLIVEAKRAGTIWPTTDPETIATLIHTLGDGLMVRRATDPEFDFARKFEAVMGLIGMLLGVKPPGAQGSLHEAPETLEIAAR